MTAIRVRMILPSMQSIILDRQLKTEGTDAANGVCP
jgi:hypothetical protein